MGGKLSVVRTNFSGWLRSERRDDDPDSKFEVVVEDGAKGKGSRGGKLSVVLPNITDNLPKLGDDAKVKDITKEKWEQLQLCLKNFKTVLTYGPELQTQNIPAHFEVGSEVEVIQDLGLSFLPANLVLYLPSRKEAVVQFVGGPDDQFTVTKCGAVRALPDEDEIQFSFNDLNDLVNVRVNNIWRVGAVVTPPAAPEEAYYMVLVFNAVGEDSSIRVPAEQMRKHTANENITLPDLRVGAVGLVGVDGLRAEVTRILWTDRIEVKFLYLNNSKNGPVLQIMMMDEWHGSLASCWWKRFFRFSQKKIG